jgi:hypothetical protein
MEGQKNAYGVKDLKDTTLNVYALKEPPFNLPPIAAGAGASGGRGGRGGRGGPRGIRI